MRIEESQKPVGVREVLPSTPMGRVARKARVEVASPGAVTTRALCALEDLGAAEATWNALQHHPAGDLGFYRNCLAREEGFGRPHVVLLDCAGAGKTLAASHLGVERITWRVGSVALGRSRARVLRLAGSGLLGTLDSSLAEALAAELLGVLARGEADALYLHELDPATPLLAALAQRAGRLQRDRGAHASTGWLLDLPPDFEAFRSGLSKKTRANLNHTTNLLRRRLGPELALACYRSPEDIGRLLTDSEAIARRTYHRRSAVGFHPTPVARARLEHAAAAGWLRGHVLYAGARPIAFSHGLLYRGTFHGRHTGFDPDFAALRPGVYLVARIVDELCGVAERFDLGVMDNDFKRSFATRSYARLSTYVFAPSPRGLALALARAASGGLDCAARRLLGASAARRLARRVAGMLAADSQ
jgi:hypothetical protein